MLDVWPLLDFTIRTQLAIQPDRDTIVGRYDSLRVVQVINFTLLNRLLIDRHLVRVMIVRLAQYVTRVDKYRVVAVHLAEIKLPLPTKLVTYTTLSALVWRGARCDCAAGIRDYFRLLFRRVVLIANVDSDFLLGRHQEGAADAGELPL